MKYILSILCAMTFPFMVFNYALFYQARQAPITGADTMIILGAKILDHPIRPSNVLQKRLDVAIQYLHNNPNTKVIVCGGQGEDEPATEASVMKQYLIEHHIPTEQIYEENRSTKTAQQFIYAQKVLNPQKTVVVTSDFHLLRSLLLAKRAGLDNVSGLASSSTHHLPHLIKEPLLFFKAWLLDYPEIE